MKNKAHYKKLNDSRAIVVWRRCFVIACFGMIMFIASNFFKKTYVVYVDSTKQIAEKRVDEIGLPLRWSYIAEKGSTYEGEIYEYKLIFDVLFWFGLSALLNIWWNSDENIRD